jgi:hypothetical protein
MSNHICNPERDSRHPGLDERHPGLDPGSIFCPGHGPSTKMDSGFRRNDEMGVDIHEHNGAYQ